MIAKNHEEMTLVGMRDWLGLQLMDQRFGDRVDRNEQHQEFKGKELPRRTQRNATNATPGSCVICWGEHRSRECPTFRKSDLVKRKELVKEHRNCFSCLGRGHSI